MIRHVVSLVIGLPLLYLSFTTFSVACTQTVDSTIDPLGCLFGAIFAAVWTLLPALVLFAIPTVYSVAMAKRGVRLLRKQLCPWCSYDSGGRELCPECGRTPGDYDPRPSAVKQWAVALIATWAAALALGVLIGVGEMAYEEHCFLAEGRAATGAPPMPEQYMRRRWWPNTDSCLVYMRSSDRVINTG
jgi:hypothetical protein